MTTIRITSLEIGNDTWLLKTEVDKLIEAYATRPMRSELDKALMDLAVARAEALAYKKAFEDLKTQCDTKDKLKKALQPFIGQPIDKKSLGQVKKTVMTSLRGKKK